MAKKQMTQREEAEAFYASALLEHASAQNEFIMRKLHGLPLAQDSFRRLEKACDNLAKTLSDLIATNSR